jgi:hypothetical protein
MRRPALILTLVLGLVVLAATAGAGAVHAVSVPGLPAKVVSITRPTALKTYATVDYSKKTVGKTTWRVVQGTGNCCEDYLTSTPKGRLLDFGGSFINYTDDQGLHWHQVQPLNPLVNGEGAIVVNPNGDIDAIGWDPYSGDHLQAFKYTAATKAWTYAEQPLHQPFYDREWITVLPGPFVINGQSYPYVTFVKGGYPWKDPAFYSTDGLTYTNASSMFLDETTGDACRELPQDVAVACVRLDAAEHRLGPDAARQRSRAGERRGHVRLGPAQPKLEVVAEVHLSRREAAAG